MIAWKEARFLLLHESGDIISCATPTPTVESRLKLNHKKMDLLCSICDLRLSQCRAFSKPCPFCRRIEFRCCLNTFQKTESWKNLSEHLIFSVQSLCCFRCRSEAKEKQTALCNSPLKNTIARAHQESCFERSIRKSATQEMRRGTMPA